MKIKKILLTGALIGCSLLSLTACLNNNGNDNNQNDNNVVDVFEDFYINLVINGETIKYHINSSDFLLKTIFPNIEGKEFLGWYFDSNYALKVPDDYIITSEGTFYGKIKDIVDGPEEDNENNNNENEENQNISLSYVINNKIYQETIKKGTTLGDFIESKSFPTNINHHWYLDSDFMNEITSTYIFEKEMIIFSRFTGGISIDDSSVNNLSFSNRGSINGLETINTSPSFIFENEFNSSQNGVIFSLTDTYDLNLSCESLVYENRFASNGVKQSINEREYINLILEIDSVGSFDLSGEYNTVFEVSMVANENAIRFIINKRIEISKNGFNITVDLNYTIENNDNNNFIITSNLSGIIENNNLEFQIRGENIQNVLNYKYVYNWNSFEFLSSINPK